MKMKYQAMLMMLFMMIAGLSFADESERGRVTSIDHKNQSIEIDGKAYRCSSRVLRRIHDGQRVEFIAERRHDGGDELVITEIQAQ